MTTDSRGRIGHRIVKRKGTQATISHGDECWYQCGLIWNPSPEPWITYTLTNGELSCDRCHVTLFLPCPATVKKGKAYLEPEALSDDLDSFRSRHVQCQVVSQA